MLVARLLRCKKAMANNAEVGHYPLNHRFIFFFFALFYRVIFGFLTRL